MKKTLLLGSFLLGSMLTANAQRVLFEDNFDSYDDFIITDIGQWTQIDVDGAPTYTIDAAEFDNQGYTGTAIVFNSSNTDPDLPTWAAHSGEKSLNFFAAITENDEDETLVGPNNDWMVTPSITLAATGNSVSFWAKSITDQYGLERLKVAISTTGNTDPADFTVISPGTSLSVPIDWTQYTYSLDAYAGQEVYIALNYVSDDVFALLVDDFSVTTTAVAGLNDNSLSNISVYPNPSSGVVNIANAGLISTIAITDLNGRIVKSSKLNDVSDAQVNISDLSSGIYMMTISSDKGTTNKKIVKN